MKRLRNKRHHGPLLLFVYGTLRSDASPHPMQRTLQQFATCLGPAKASGVLYEIDTYPGLIARPGRRHWVKGELYRICPRYCSLVLDLLDDYEQCTPRYPAPLEYRRQTITCFCQHVAPPVKADTYLYLHSIRHRLQIESGDFVTHLNRIGSR